LVDQGKYEQSWDAAAPAFQAAITKLAWIQALTQARGPFEPFGTRTLLGTKYAATLPNAPPGPYVVIQYRAKVAGGREVPGNSGNGDPDAESGRPLAGLGLLRAPKPLETMIEVGA
jgi:hypothetical protein